MKTLLFLVVMHLMPWVSIANAADTTSAPSGAFQPFELCFVDGQKEQKGRSDVITRGTFRDGKMATPSMLSVRHFIATLTLADGKITGTFAHFRTKDDQKPLILFTVDASVNGRTITGSYKASANGAAYDGKLDGRLIDPQELRNINDFKTKAGWPCWSGPMQSLVATPTGVKMVDSLKKARLLWRSEEILPAGLGNLTAFTRSPGQAFGDGFVKGSRTGGGGSSPVVSDDRVYQFFLQPAGDELGNMRKPLEEVATEAGVNEISPWTKEKWAVKADDVVVCIDARTGETLWKTTFEKKGYNFQDHKNGPTNCTPCVGGGRVFTLGSAGRLYALNAASGKPLWEKQIGPDKYGNRDFNNAPILVGDVVVTGDHRSTLYGFDAATGDELWKQTGLNHASAVPVVWWNGNAAYVLAYTQPMKGKTSVMHCLELKTGKALWSVELGMNPAKGLCVQGDRVVAIVGLGTAKDDVKNDAKELAKHTGAQCVAYQLSTSGATLAWSVPCAYVTEHLVPVATPSGHVYLSGPKETRALELNSGREVGRVAVTGARSFAANEGYIFVAEDRLFVRPDGSHGESDLWMLGPLPDSLAVMGEHWHPPHPPTTSYHLKPMTCAVVEGRVFMRGYDGIYCYDLRDKGE